MIRILLVAAFVATATLALLAAGLDVIANSWEADCGGSPMASQCIADRSDR